MFVAKERARYQVLSVPVAEEFAGLDCWTFYFFYFFTFRKQRCSFIHVFLSIQP